MSALQLNHHKNTIWAEITRPGAKNAINFEVMEELENLLDYIEETPEIRVLVLSGSHNDYFATGGDLKEFHELKTAEEGHRMAERMINILNRIENGHFWSIACINGDAYGGGVELMLALDFAIASKTAKFGFTQGKFFLPPGWGGLTRLIERVGRPRALDWLGSQALIDANLAFTANLINEVSITADLRNNTWEWAERLSALDRDLIGCLKDGSARAIQSDRKTSMEAELREFSKFWSDERHHQAVETFLNRKRASHSL